MDWRIGRLGDAALLLALDERIDAATNARVHAAARRIAADRPTWVLDVVPAYASVAVFIDADAFPTTGDPLAEAERHLRPLLARADDADMEDARIVEIPVRYGGDEGPDLERVAAQTGLSTGDVLRRHAAGEYTVAMLGFAPGFPYLLGLDPVLATPRLATPRTRVPAGSVAIGGAQTGLYPRPGPGGWNLIGRTDAVLFDPAREPPALLAPGDRVRFLVERAP
ncbi:MAG: 5-oxoprolinase subunit PxpB [Lysobacter sp.]|nr:5-oxoprolinase subunit PxpB [Lysobacter sp.]